MQSLILALQTQGLQRCPLLCKCKLYICVVPLLSANVQTLSLNLMFDTEHRYSNFWHFPICLRASLPPQTGAARDGVITPCVRVRVCWFCGGGVRSTELGLCVRTRHVPVSQHGRAVGATQPLDPVRRISEVEHVQ